MNQFICTLDATNVLEYNNQGKALLLMVSKQNLKPPLGTCNKLRTIENRLEMRKLWPQSKGGQKLFKKPLNTMKADS